VAAASSLNDLNVNSDRLVFGARLFIAFSFID
jgi:hypothetical protein